MNQLPPTRLSLLAVEVDLSEITNMNHNIEIQEEIKDKNPVAASE
jgi:hypothetical protein